MMQHLFSSRSLGRIQIEELLASAAHFAEGTADRSCALNSIIGLWFQDSSTRTRVGFEVAALRLGAKPFNLSEHKYTQRMSTEESFEDTFNILSDYADLICLRGDAGIVKTAATSRCPVINCGNGDDEHPTQALIDLFSIKKYFGRIEDLRICLIGDLRHMRTAHSLVLSLAQFENIQIDLVSPEALRLPKQYYSDHKRPKINEVEHYRECLSEADVIYMTGFAPKTPIGNFDEQVRGIYQMNREAARMLKSDAIILCPLPRIDEITKDIDVLPQAAYFTQSHLGLFMRMAILERWLR